MDHWRGYGGSSMKMWWLIGGDMVAHWRKCGGSMAEIWWLIDENVVAHWWM